MAATLTDSLMRMMHGFLLDPAKVAGPLEQFEITRLIPIPVNQEGAIDLSLTNSALWMFIGIGAAILFLTAATRRLQLVPGGMQSLGEMTYEFVAKMLRDATGDEGRPFFPFIFTLFLFIFMSNFLGLLPTIPGTPHGLHVFTPTSHIIVTFTLAMAVIGMVMIVGFVKNGFGFLKLFVPSGVPWWLMPIITPIEIISFLSRPISLSVRLFANMLAGHMILKVFAGFVTGLIAAGGALTALAILPLFGIVGIYILEFLVAFLQAFVFAVLACIYLQDALHPAH